MPQQCRVVVTVTSVCQHIRCGTDSFSILSLESTHAAPSRVSAEQQKNVPHNVILSNFSNNQWVCWSGVNNWNEDEGMHHSPASARPNDFHIFRMFMCEIAGKTDCPICSFEAFRGPHTPLSPPIISGSTFAIDIKGLQSQLEAVRAKVSLRFD